MGTYLTVVMDSVFPMTGFVMEYHNAGIAMMKAQIHVQLLPVSVCRIIIASNQILGFYLHLFVSYCGIYTLCPFFDLAGMI